MGNQYSGAFTSYNKYCHLTSTLFPPPPSATYSFEYCLSRPAFIKHATLFVPSAWAVEAILAGLFFSRGELCTQWNVKEAHSCSLVVLRRHVRSIHQVSSLGICLGSVTCKMVEEDNCASFTIPFGAVQVTSTVIVF